MGRMIRRAGRKWRFAFGEKSAKQSQIGNSKFEIRQDTPGKSSSETGVEQVGKGALGGLKF